MSTFAIQSITNQDKEWIVQFVNHHWGSSQITSRGKLTDVKKLPGFIAYFSKERVGLITYTIEGEECEIISLDSTKPGRGIGTSLLKAVIDTAKKHKIKRVWLITTNDNLDALRFYQKRGFDLVAVHRNALKESRKLKPHIPMIGKDGIPLKDEIELELKV